MLADIELQVNTDVVQNLIRTIQTAPQAATEAMTRIAIPRLQQRARQLLGAPGKPSHPLRWAPSRHPEDQDKTPNTVFGYYSRQKAAYFASDAFGAGIPFIRTGRLVQGWLVELRQNGSTFELVLTNPVEYWPFVQGPWQQPYHEDTGWSIRRDAAQVLSLEADDQLAIAWHFALFGRYGGT